MAALIPGVLPESIQNSIKSSKILVVGAGGIGCELLKNLVLSGFHDIEVIDLDTIDVSNLNRQFLFHKQHVGRSKAQVARESALRFCPKAKIVAYHDTIMSSDYGVTFYQRFNLVLNALDNRAARNHVNRMCLAADITLVESGSAGYLGQVTVIRKGSTECYECQPKAVAKTFPGCTIRNTPSEPIHCIVWSKHLFNQLFGESDPDEDVSPDSADPELRNETNAALTATAGGEVTNGATTSSASNTTAATAVEANGNVLDTSSTTTSSSSSTEDVTVPSGAFPATTIAGNVERTSTRTWAQSHGYDPQKLFSKLFHDDIKYLLSMDKLWSSRRPPTPLVWDDIINTAAAEAAKKKEVTSSGTSGGGSGLIKDQVLWSLRECLEVLTVATNKLSKKFKALSEGDHLVWDKDDDTAMDFVTACANIRSTVFGITNKTRFDVKSMAGNIIPAIATTNAIIAGLLVLEAVKLLDNRFHDCRTVYLNRVPNPRGRLLVPCRLEKPVEACYVCSAKNEVCVQTNTALLTLATLEDKVLKAALNMVAPDVEVADGKGTILISSEPGETTHNLHKTLKEMKVVDGTRLNCDDFLQNYTLAVTILHTESLEGGAEFKIVADAEKLKKLQDSATPTDQPTTVDGTAATTAECTTAGDSDDDIVMLEPEEEKDTKTAESDLTQAKKRKSIQESEQPVKKPRLQTDEDDIIIL